MKCPQCATDSVVLATRVFKTVFLKRSRKCFNEHRFESVEMPIGAVWAPRLDKIEAGAATRAKATKAREAVLAQPGLSSRLLAARLGLNPAHVRTIRSRDKCRTPN